MKEDNQKINILVVFTTGFTTVGGLTTVMMNYWRAMNKEDLHFDFASNNMPDKPLLDEINSAGCVYYKLPSRSNILAYFMKLVSVCKGYDILHLHGNSATSLLELTAARVAGVKSRFVHNHNSETLYPRLNKFLLPLFNRSYTQAIACSELAGNHLFTMGGGKILHNAIDVKKFAYVETVRNEVRKELCFTNDDVVIGNISKFVMAKNHVFLLEVFSEYLKLNPKAKLLLVGDGILKQQIEDKIKALGIQSAVKMTGMRTDANRLFQAIDVVLFPSLHEGLPLSLVEAQVAGLPIFLADTITQQVAIGKDVVFLSLKKSATDWAKMMMKYSSKYTREQRYELNKSLVDAAGYNIETEAQILRQMYIDTQK